MIKEEYKSSQLADASVLIVRKSVGISGITAMSIELSSLTKLVALKRKFGRKSMSRVANITIPVDI